MGIFFMWVCMVELEVFEILWTLCLTDDQSFELSTVMPASLPSTWCINGAALMTRI